MMERKTIEILKTTRQPENRMSEEEFRKQLKRLKRGLLK